MISKSVDKKKALVSVILLSLYHTNLRTLWEMGRQNLGVSLLTYGIAEGSLLAIALTFFAHELAVSIIPLASAYYLVRRDYARGLALASLSVPALAIAAIKGLGTFTQSVDSLHVLLYLPYLYWPLVPLAYLGWKRGPLWVKLWLLVCVVFTLSPIVTQRDTWTWFRWGLYATYPLTILAALGLSTLLEGGDTRRTLAFAGFAAVVLFLGFNYMFRPPEYPFEYFGVYNAYKEYFPTSMLQGPLPTKALLDSISCLDHAPHPLLLHESIWYPAKVVKNVNAVKVVQPITRGAQDVREEFLGAVDEVGGHAYTVWFVDRKYAKWYHMDWILREGKVLVRCGTAAVFEVDHRARK